MKYAIIALTLSVFVAACSAAPSDKKMRRLSAPDVVAYTLEQQRQAKAELESCAVPMLESMIQDYCVMRDQSRVLAGAKPICTVRP